MNEYRLRWMLEMQRRDNRIVDAALLGTIQSSTSFFASTSLIAIGSSLALLRGTDDVLRIFADLPFGGTCVACGVRGQGTRPHADLRIRLLQIRLGVPALQL